MNEVGFPPGKQAVIGIDLGTVYSGISFIPKISPSLVVTTSPRVAHPQVKEPTVVLQTSEGDWLFGRTALDRFKLECAKSEDNNRIAGFKLYRLFRLNLMATVDDEMEDIEVMASNTAHAEVLLKIYAIALSKMKERGIELIEQNAGTNVTADNVLWVLTVPANITERGQLFMREAARKAGMCE